MHIKASDGTFLHVKDMGEGEPVLLIHGWPLTGDMFDYQTLALLEAGYRVITYDRRGFGQSGHPAGGYDYDRLADDLADVINEFDLDRLILVGFSMGGGEVARYLARHGSAKVSRAVLISAVVPYLLKDASNPDGVELQAFEEMKDKIREDRFAFLESFAQQFYGVGLIVRPVSSALLQWSFSLGCMASPKAMLDCVDAFARTDFRPDMAAFDIPTMIIHGTGDATVPIDPSARAAARLVPQARFLEYDGEPHGLFATAPDRLNADLLSFLGETAPVGERGRQVDTAVESLERPGQTDKVALYP